MENGADKEVTDQAKRPRDGVDSCASFLLPSSHLCVNISIVQSYPQNSLVCVMHVEG